MSTVRWLSRLERCASNSGFQGFKSLSGQFHFINNKKETFISQNSLKFAKQLL